MVHRVPTIHTILSLSTQLVLATASVFLLSRYVRWLLVEYELLDYEDVMTQDLWEVQMIQGCIILVLACIIDGCLKDTGQDVKTEPQQEDDGKEET